MIFINIKDGVTYNDITKHFTWLEDEFIEDSLTYLELTNLIYMDENKTYVSLCDENEEELGIMSDLNNAGDLK